MGFYVFPVVIVVFVLNLTPFYCVLFILHFQLLRCAARRQFFPTFSGNGNIFFATHLTFLIRSSPLRPGESISIWLFSIFPFLFFLSAVFFARFGSFRLDFFYIKSAICANVCLSFPVCVFVGRRFELFFPLMFSISRASHWSADKQQTSCVFVRWKSALFVCVFICISLFYCWLYLFLSAAKFFIHLLHISRFGSVAFWSIDLHTHEYIYSN